MKILAIDLGLKGAVAQLNGRELMSARNLPLHNRLPCATTLEPLIKQCDILAIESVSASPRASGASAFILGSHFGAMALLAHLCGIKPLWVAPTVWKAGLKLSASKSESLTRARGLWQDVEIQHDGQAEAALLGLYAALHNRL